LAVKCALSKVKHFVGTYSNVVMCSYVILQVRVLYRWLTNQPVNKMHVIDRVPKNKNSALYHLWMLKTKKQRYSKLFSLLCR